MVPFPLLQYSSTVFIEVISKPLVWFSIKKESTIWQPLTSEIVTLYIPDCRLLIVLLVAPFDHKKEVEPPVDCVVI